MKRILFLPLILSLIPTAYGQSESTGLAVAGKAEYVTVFAYMGLLVLVGFLFSRMNKSSDDFLRGGGRASWWMVGMSSFMTGFSAWTFTGGAGAVYKAGFSVMWIYWSQVAGYLVAAIWLAPWFRQLRITAAGELSRLRYSEHLAQFSTWIFLPLTPVYPAIQLYALGVFSSAVFGIDLELIIIALGIVILLYSTSGGLWGVMATDFLQGIVLLPFTVLVAVLALIEIGGLGVLFDTISSAEYSGVFQPIKARGEYPGGQFTWAWAIAIFVNTVTGSLGMMNALRYRACKDGKDARKAAVFTGVLQLLGPLVWFIPPAVALFLFSGQVEQVQIANPSEASYAIAALNLLPAGLAGIMVVGMFSATMSSMDTGLANGSANIVKIIYPGLARLFKKTPSENPDVLLRMSQICTFVIGGLIVGGAIYLSRKGGDMLTVMLNFGAFMAGTGLSYLYGLFFKRVPSWCPYVGLITGLVPAFLGLYSEEIFGESWSFQLRYFVNFGVGTVSFFATMPFWKYESQEYKERVERFFRTMKTPIDVEKETGDTRETDRGQLKIMGLTTLGVGVFFFGIGWIPAEWGERFTTWSMSLFVSLIGLGMFWKSHTSSKERTES
jgi:SSS family transporter